MESKSLKIAPKALSNYHKNNLVAICSGTKGIGKTWLAITLCHTLSLLKKRVLFFDADCGLENISYQLGLENYASYTNLLSGSLILNNAATRFEKGRFDVINARSGDATLNAAPLGRAQILAKDLQYLSGYYDYIVIDCSDDGLKPTNVFLNICKTIVVITNAEPSSVTATYKKLEDLKKINPDAELKAIINRATSYEEGRQIFKTLLKAAEEYIKVNLNLLGIIRQDARIRDSVLNQSLLLNRYPQCEGAEDTIMIAKKLLKE